MARHEALTFDELRAALVRLLEVPAEQVTLQASLSEDLGMTSLDVVRLAQALDDLLEAEIELEEWALDPDVMATDDHRVSRLLDWVRERQAELT